MGMNSLTTIAVGAMIVANMHLIFGSTLAGLGWSVLFVVAVSLDIRLEQTKLDMMEKDAKAFSELIKADLKRMKDDTERS